jgi:hypothetical protein
MSEFAHLYCRKLKSDAKRDFRRWLLVQTPVLLFLTALFSVGGRSSSQDAAAFAMGMLAAAAWVGVSAKVIAARFFPSWRHSRACKALTKRGHADEFAATICSELSSETAVRHYGRKDRLLLIITPKWLILLESPRSSFIRKREELVWVYHKGRGLSTMNFAFSDGTLHSIDYPCCGQEIKAVLAQEFPQVRCEFYTANRAARFRESPISVMKSREEIEYYEYVAARGNDVS